MSVDLFTTSTSKLDNKPRDTRCCEVCTTPLFGLCKLVCKYRKAMVCEWFDDMIGKGNLK